jgi:predicted DCC family thiol-disulfide oxidoreductase YuxK
MRTPADGPVLLYDGVCGFCNRAVQFVLARDRRGTMRFAPLQGDFAVGVLARHPECRGIDSLILVEPAHPAGERIAVRSAALLGLAAYLGGPWRAATLLRIVPRAIRDWAYDRFASVRYRVFGRFDSCPLPSADQRTRFL